MPLIMHEYICIYSYYCYVRSTPNEGSGKTQIFVDDYINKRKLYWICMFAAICGLLTFISSTGNLYHNIIVFVLSFEQIENITFGGCLVASVIVGIQAANLALFRGQMPVKIWWSQ